MVTKTRLLLVKKKNGKNKQNLNLVGQDTYMTWAEK